jgi:hypothetical protein
MKFEELLIYNLLVEAFQDEDILLSESIRLSRTLQEIITAKKLVMPETVKGIERILIRDDKVLGVYDGRKVQEIKIGKVLQRIWPDMGTNEMNEIIGKIRAKLSEDVISFTVEDKVAKWYKSGTCGEVKSCMTDKPDVVKFYDTQDSIKIVIAWRNKSPIGRALLWHNVEGAGSKGIYMDRVYPPDKNLIVEAFRTHAEKNGWESNGIGPMAYQLENLNKLHRTKIPYLDTFSYGDISGKIFNQSYKNEKISLEKQPIIYHLDDTDGTLFIKYPDWFEKNIENTKNPIFTWSRASGGKRVVLINWLNGTWKSGTWENGTWEDGTWKDGIWKWGMWKAGVWENGTWENGTWNAGYWKNGVWQNGIWNNGWWIDGTWNTGVWENGLWENGVWKDGNWKSGKWLSGLIYDPKKTGNLKQNWKWDGNYVESPINPKEYFAK